MLYFMWFVFVLTGRTLGNFQEEGLVSDTTLLPSPITGTLLSCSYCLITPRWPSRLQLFRSETKQAAKTSKELNLSGDVCVSEPLALREEVIPNKLELKMSQDIRFWHKAAAARSFDVFQSTHTPARASRTSVFLLFYVVAGWMHRSDQQHMNGSSLTVAGASVSSTITSS